MKPKPINRSYWIITVPFALIVALSAIPTEAGKEVMALLHYPNYLLYILFVAKVLGGFALVQPWFTTLKEWAYAGFTIDFIGAAVSGMIVLGDPVFVFMPLIFGLVMGITYYLWKKKMELTVTKGLNRINSPHARNISCF